MPDRADSRARPVAGDDAGKVLIADPAALPPSMAFDHALIISDYVHFKKTGRRPDPMEQLDRWRTRRPLTP